jgi:hypothetical protein
MRFQWSTFLKKEITSAFIESHKISVEYWTHSSHILVCFRPALCGSASSLSVLFLLHYIISLHKPSYKFENTELKHQDPSVKRLGQAVSHHNFRADWSHHACQCNQVKLRKKLCLPKCADNNTHGRRDPPMLKEGRGCAPWTEEIPSHRRSTPGWVESASGGGVGDWSHWTTVGARWPRTQN